MVTSILVLLLATASLGGATMAWFTTEDGGRASVFTAGTVNLSQPIIVSEPNWQPGECETITWKVENTGTKSGYIRIKLNETFTSSSDTAWGMGTDFGGGNAQYFEYAKGEGSEGAPFETILGVGSNYDPVGTVTVWDNGSHLYIKYNTYANVSMDVTHLYAGLEIPTKSAPGQLGWQNYPDNPNEDLYELDKIFDSQDSRHPTVIFANLSSGGENSGQKIYIAAHTTVTTEQKATWTLISDDSLWIEGSDGYLYYAYPVAAGESVYIDFEVCLPEGFDSSEYSFYLEAESVQSTNNAVDYLWPENPY